MAVHRSYTITRSGNLKAVYKHARVTCNTEIKNALDGALDEAVIAAKAIAPVYDQARWATWYNMEHHWSPPPGTLKESIFHTKTVARARGVEYTAKFGSPVKYASYIEDGFRHKRIKRRKRYEKFVVGKHFIESSLDIVVPPTFHIRLRRAVENMLTTPAIGA